VESVVGERKKLRSERDPDQLLLETGKTQKLKVQRAEDLSCQMDRAWGEYLEAMEVVKGDIKEFHRAYHDRVAGAMAEAGNLYGVFTEECAKLKKVHEEESVRLEDMIETVKVSSKKAHRRLGMESGQDSDAESAKSWSSVGESFNPWEGVDDAVKAKEESKAIVSLTRALQWTSMVKDPLDETRYFPLVHHPTGP
jgi:hypothetical protein